MKETRQMQEEGRVDLVVVVVVVISIVPVLGGLGHQIASGRAD
jgi:hypothetical protein